MCECERKDHRRDTRSTSRGLAWRMTEPLYHWPSAKERGRERVGEIEGERECRRDRGWIMWGRTKKRGGGGTPVENDLLLDSAGAPICGVCDNDWEGFPLCWIICVLHWRDADLHRSLQSWVEKPVFHRYLNNLNKLPEPWNFLVCVWLCVVPLFKHTHTHTQKWVYRVREAERVQLMWSTLYMVSLEATAVLVRVCMRCCKLQCSKVE